MGPFWVGPCLSSESSFVQRRSFWCRSGENLDLTTEKENISRRVSSLPVPLPCARLHPHPALPTTSSAPCSRPTPACSLPAAATASHLCPCAANSSGRSQTATVVGGRRRPGKGGGAEGERTETEGTARSTPRALPAAK